MKSRLEKDGFILENSDGYALEADENQPCCCGKGCPVCADPEFPRECPTNTPCDFYMGDNTTGSTAVIVNWRRWGQVAFSYDWSGRNGSGTFNWDIPLSSKLSTSSPHCDPKALVSNVTVGNFTERGNGGNRPGVVTLSPGGTARYPLLFGAFPNSSGGFYPCAFGPDINNPNAVQGLLENQTLRIVCSTGNADITLNYTAHNQHGTGEVRAFGHCPFTFMRVNPVACENVAKSGTFVKAGMKADTNCACSIGIQFDGHVDYTGGPGFFSADISMYSEFTCTCLYWKGAAPEGRPQRSGLQSSGALGESGCSNCNRRRRRH